MQQQGHTSDVLLMAIGDSHGNSRFDHSAIERAARLRDKVDRDVFIVSVGDFGFWPGLRGESFVAGVDELARRHNLAFWAIDGNHDYPGDGRSSRAGYRAWSNPTPSEDQPGLVHVPRGTVVEIGGVTIGLCGGGASPDQDQRQPGTSWWPEEMITDREVALIESSGRTVDLLIAHDTPWRPPDFATSLDVSPKVRTLMAENQLRLAEIVAAWQPRLLVHGHFHHSYRATAPGPDGTSIQVIGIDDENIDTSIETVDLAAFADKMNQRERRAATGATDTSLPT